MSTVPFVILPSLVVVLYFAIWFLAPHFFLRFVASEQGLVELATAGFFLAAAVLSSRLVVATRVQLPVIVRALYALFALAALFVALEEISYGQHLFGWSSPEYFREHNLQGEVNLHNMFGSKPSKRMHMIANIGTLAGFAALPLLLRITSGSTSLRLPPAMTRWAYYLIPGLDLLAIIVLAQLVAWLKKIPGAGVDHNELRELLWAWAAFGYIVLMRRRFRTDEELHS